MVARCTVDYVGRLTAHLPGAIGGLMLLVTGWPFWVTNLAAIAATAVLLPFSAVGLTLQFYDFRHEEQRTEPVGLPAGEG